MNLYFSHFCTSFFIGSHRICLCAKVCNLVFIICSLLSEIDYVTDKLKATFSWMKNTLSVLKFSPQNAENRILELWSFKIFSICAQTPSPPRKRGLTASCWYSRLLYSNLLATSISIETPEGHSSVLHCTTLLCIIELTVFEFFKSF